MSFTPWALLQWVSALALSAFVIMFLIFAVFSILQSMKERNAELNQRKRTNLFKDIDIYNKDK